MSRPRISEELRLTIRLEEIERPESLQSLVRWCIELADRLLGEWESARGPGKANVALSIIEYMHANFDKEISLSGIADQTKGLRTLKVPGSGAQYKQLLVMQELYRRQCLMYSKKRSRLVEERMSIRGQRVRRHGARQLMIRQVDEAKGAGLA